MSRISTLSDRVDSGSVLLLPPFISAKVLWSGVVLVSIVLAEALTAAMELLLKGEITIDYLLTALVCDMTLTPPLVTVGILMHGQLRELQKNSEVERERNRELHASSLRTRTLIEVARDAIIVTDADSGRIVDCNRQAEVLLERPRLEIIGSELTQIYQNVSASLRAVERVNPDFIQRLQNEPTLLAEYALVRSDGTLIPVESSSNVFEMDDRRFVHCSFREITERKRAEERLRLLATAFEFGSSGVLVTDAQCRIVEVNPAFTALTGYKLAEIQGRHPRLLAASNEPDSPHNTLWEKLEQNGFWQGELINKRRDGRGYITFATMSVVRDEFGVVLYFVGSLVDITERRQAEDRIRHLAHHDPLTNLPNRYFLSAHLEQAITEARTTSAEVAVMFIDLDNFKRINDTLGHRTGDSLLEEVGRRLRNSVRPHDVVARLGGDEFVVVVSGLEVAATVSAAASRILGNLSLPFVIGNYHLHTGASIGVAIFPADGTNAEVLMKNADVAMYSVKARGRNAFQFFTEDLDVVVRERMELENDLREALKNESFELHYQPIYEMRSGRLYGFEALLRWRHPSLGEIKPERLIPVAEESLLIVPLGKWVINEACRQLHIWREAGMDQVRMAINVSIRQLQDIDFGKFVADVMEKYALQGSDLEFEITESAIVENLAQIQTVLKELNQSGIVLAIDDFGTGHSSLARLKQLPVQRLKIDRSFIGDIDGESADGHICSAIITLAHSLQLCTVAEGVETLGQWEFLRRASCDLIQGNLSGMPLPAEALTFLVENQRVSAEPRSANIV